MNISYKEPRKWVRRGVGGTSPINCEILKVKTWVAELTNL